MFFNGLMVQNNIKEGFFSEETKFRSVVEKHLESYWRIRISIISHETRGMSTTLKELKENFDINLPLISPYLKFDDPNINDDVVVYLKFSGRGKNLKKNLDDLVLFIKSDYFTDTDIKYGIINNTDEFRIHVAYKPTKKYDIILHNENEYSAIHYKNNPNWSIYKTITTVQKFVEGKKQYIHKYVKFDLITLYYLEHINGKLSDEIYQEGYKSELRKLKLDQLFSD
jgi:hypothetical protein